jgi:hypothetical protein
LIRGDSNDSFSISSRSLPSEERNLNLPVSSSWMADDLLRLKKIIKELMMTKMTKME